MSITMADWCQGRYATPLPPTHNYAEVAPTWFKVPDMRAGGCSSRFGRKDTRKGTGATVDSPLTDGWKVPLSAKTNSSRTKYRTKYNTQQGPVFIPEYTADSEVNRVFKPNSADLAAVQAASIGPHHILPTRRRAY